MSKLPKAQIQKILLMAIGCLITIYAFFSFLIAPVREGRSQTESAIASLDKQIQDAKTQLMRTKNLRVEADAAAETADLIREMIPGGAPIAWFPTRINRFFANHGIADVTPRLINTRPSGIVGLEEFALTDWSISIPATDFLRLGVALAGLENEQPLVEINAIRVTAGNQDPANQLIEIELRCLVHR